MKLGKLLAVSVILAGNICVFGQSIDPSLETGIKPYGSYHGGDLDSVNLSNGNLTLHIPLSDYSQRGDLSYGIQLTYNNKGWSVNPNCNSVTGVCSPFWLWNGEDVSLNSFYGGRGLISAQWTSADQVFVDWEPAYKGAQIKAFTATTTDGSVHQLAYLVGGGMFTIDGTNIWYDGTAQPNHQQGLTRNARGVDVTNLKDTNGNFFSISTSTLTDTIGRSLPTPQSTATTDFSGCTGPLPITGAGIMTFPGFNRGIRLVKFCGANVALQTNFQASAYYNSTLTTVAEHPVAATANPMLQSVVLYNGVSWTSSPAWTFEYNSRSPGDSASVNYGDLTKITLPTGGTISYTWGTNDTCTALFESPKAPVSRVVTSRTVNANDGTGPHTWTYGGGGVTDPNGNDTIHTFTDLNGSCSSYETKTQYFQGSYKSGQLLKTVTTDYRWIANPFDNVVPGNQLQTVTQVFPIRITTTWPSGKVTKIEKDYDSNLLISAPSQFTGTYGNVIEMREYDYGDATHTPALVRRTDYTYKAFDGSTTSSSYLAANLLDLISSITVYDGNSYQVSKTTYGYDEFPLQLSNISTQHDTSLVNPGARGNRTSVSRWLNTPGGTLTTKTTYYDTGTPYQVTDPAGNITTNFYGTGFQSGASFAGAYVTQVQNALQQNTYFDYDFNTGLRTATKDANGQIATSDYDFLNRTLHSNAPDKGQITWVYNDTQPPTVTVTNTISGTQNTVQVSPRNQEADLDGLGRMVTTKLTSDPEGTDLVDTTYDALGRVATVSNPHRSTASSTDGITTTYYDALGRTVQVAPQDGTLLPAGTAATQCQANNVCTDYSQFPIVTVTDQAGNQRRSRTDALGRLVEVDEPAPIGPPTYAQGSVNISSVSSGGGVQSVQVLTHAATQATGWVRINGQDRNTIPPDCPIGQHCIEYDNGDCWINQFSALYGNDATSTIATKLANVINSTTTSPMSATVSASTISLISKQASYSSNFSISSGCTSTNTDFSGPSGFSTTQSGPTLTGGTDAVYTTVYDSGTVTLTIPGCSTSPSAPYSQTGNNSISSVASALASSVNSMTSCPVTASSSSGTINFNAKQPGSSVNVTVTGSSSTSQGAYFSQPSFSASSGTVSGGLDHTGGLLTPATTLYSYDALGNLTQVQQQGFSATCDANCRVRSFQYDSLSRLLTAKNPESGTITYSYDADSNLLQKTSPAPNQTGAATQTTSYCYDALNRVMGKAYMAQSCPLTSPVVTFTYDGGTNGIGRLTSLTDQAGSGSYTYDVMGRIASESRTIAGISKSMSYLYHLDGSVNQLTYPSNAMVTYTPSAAARMLSAVDSGHGMNYATGATYAPTGALTGFVNGNSGSFAGITNSLSYNKRLQPISMSAASPTQTVFSIGYDFHLGNGDNGNVYALSNNKDNTRNQTFIYDQLNRLISAQNAGTDCTQKVLGGNLKFWGNTYTYDAWGNLTNKTKMPTACSGENLSMPAGANNQLQGGNSYDAAGNMTYNANAGNGYSYDQENRITAASGFTYIYDADGNRVEKSNGSTGTLYWYMSPGIVAESDLNGNLQSEYVFFDGERVARKDFPSNAVSYYFSDHLKTTDIVTDAQGNIKNESDYYPWGGELSFSANDSNHYKFTGKERDSETGLDYFGARYYSNGLGRFITPDWSTTPVPVPYADLDDPQSLNQYGYVRNLPTTKADLDGHQNTTAPLVSDEEVAQLIRREATKDLLRSGLRLLGDAALVVGVVVLIHDLAYPPTVGQSDEEERAQIQQASQERAAQNGGVDPQQEPQQEPEPATASGGTRQGAGKRGGENADAALGREKHAEFSEKAKAKGWQTEPRLTDPKTGKQVKPDAVTKTGRPVELKPRTASGKAAGKQQLNKYERATRKKGRVIYYEKNANQ